MKLEQIIKLKLNNFNIEAPGTVTQGEVTTNRKQDFVIPEPGEKESQEEYISRCISSIIDEYGQEQAAGICYGQWDKK